MLQLLVGLFSFLGLKRGWPAKEQQLKMMAAGHPDAVAERQVELFNVGNTKSHGHLLLRPQFLPAGSLKVRDTPTATGSKCTPPE